MLSLASCLCQSAVDPRQYESLCSQASSFRPPSPRFALVSLTTALVFTCLWAIAVGIDHSVLGRMPSRRRPDTPRVLTLSRSLDLHLAKPIQTTGVSDAFALRSSQWHGYAHQPSEFGDLSAATSAPSVYTSALPLDKFPDSELSRLN
ncbi:hypothetical protein BDW22DRAFT_261913 [Trametopsis cervina]|nr:hypothetical protein BDW22DRAFT_261913 [Trametopsis cervina]